MKYKLLKPIKGLDWKVGEEKEASRRDGGIYAMEIRGVDIALLEHCGFIEEVKEWKADELNLDDEYWFIDDFGLCKSSIWYNDDPDKFRLKTNNIFQSEADAEKRLKEIMES